MRILPFCYICPRDLDLFLLLIRSWYRIGRSESWVGFCDRHEREAIMRTGFDGFTLRERPDFFHPWSGWPHAMSKLDGWRQMVSDPAVKDDDYILYCDSDTFFFTPEILTQLEGYDFIGFPHSEYKRVDPLGRDWSWLSGCFQAGRAGFVREVVNIDYRELDKARQELLHYKFSHNEDVVMSYLFARCGAKENRLDGNKWYEPNPQDAMLGKRTQLSSFVHLNGNPERWCGVPVTGKWDIPRALREVGVYP